MRKSMWLAALVLIFGSSYPAAAFPLPCMDCTCGHSCAQSCDFTSTCGAYGVCSGAGGCGGCLTIHEIESFDKALRGSKDAAILSSSGERGEVAARLTWRLTQHVEESGLGTVFAGGTRFRLPFRAPALAFVHAGAPKDVQVPDLAVEFVTRPGRVDAVVAGWLTTGVKVVLTVDPSTRSVVVYQGQDIRTLGEADYLELPDVVPGWSLRVGELFE